MDYDRDIAPRPHRLHLVRYEEDSLAHVCTVEGNPRHIRVALDIDGVSPESLIGKTVEVECTYGFIFLAHNVRIVGEQPESSTRTDEVSV